MKPDPALARLQAQNAQLQIDARRHQKLLRQQRSVPVAKAAPPQPSPFQLVDPRRVPRASTKVLPPFSPPLSLGIRLGAAIGAELRAMAIEVRALIRQLEQAPGVCQAMDMAPDGARHEFEMLQAKWGARFETLAHAWAQRMVTDVTTQSSAQLTIRLKDVADRIQIQATMATPRMRALVEAASQSSVGLITRIPQRFLGDVQAQVMSAITTGSGLNELVPYLTKRYKGDARHAHLVALDQIRKVSESVNEARLTSLGIESYVWIATGGERYPRKLHHEHLNGKTFRYDDPPVIDERTGVRGKPGDLIGCRCRSRPVLNFAKMAA